MKSPGAFKTISEVAEELDLPQHVLRFWESRFSQIRPMKRAGGRRYYRPEDVDLVRGVKVLLYGEGFTIKGVQRLLKEKGVAFVAAAGQGGSTTAALAAVGNAAVQDPDDRADGASELAAAPPAENVELDPLDEAYPEPSGVAAGLHESQRELLESVLADLLAAKRMLDQAR